MTTNKKNKQPGSGLFRTTLFILLGVMLGILIDRVLLAGVIPAALVPASAVNDFRLMAQTWNLIDAHFVDRKAIKPTRMTYAAISGMVNSLGDTGHTTFLTPAEVRMEHTALQGHFAGIGAEVEYRKGHVVIVTPIDGTPAQRAHLKPGDIILKVDDHSVSDLSLLRVVGMIRGKAGTYVTLTLRQMGTGKTRTVTLVRAEIPLRSVSWATVPGTFIADIRISRFSKGTAQELDKALVAARRQGARGIILDLRNDPGGLLYEAIDVASLLIPKGNVLLEKNVQGKIKPIPIIRNVPKSHLPIAVLINRGTASAAEIVAGALRDDVHALLVGTRTFGTGTVLRQFMLSNGSAVLLAVREWLTPDGHTIWHRGIRPTIMVSLPPTIMLLFPDQLRHMKSDQLRHSKDRQFLTALARVKRKIRRQTIHLDRQLIQAVGGRRENGA